ncbi:MAG: flagellar biosynthesis protein FlhA [Phycisphaeraceae bacterium]|nr:flagellar biosynthesis protein FlhA [Phycisphaeraceae bacterium]
MPEATHKLSIPDWLNRLAQFRSLLVPLGFVGLMVVIVVPLSPVVMDVLIAANIAMAALILLTTIYVQSPLEFSVFPSLLLATTLFRLVLNIGTTRLILSADAQSPEHAMAVAGKVIEAFSSFVAGNSLVVGLILFIILIIVQFVVITKGATRISEVAARFTLDGMPGKQMAIDADLNAGLIDEKEARRRRDAISQEADFYGAMDGAAKFVRGDAIAGIIITLVNIAGGFAVGTFEKGWPWTTSLEVFTRLTIGDGLVSQLPAFVISIAAGLIVTRSSGRHNLGSELAKQLTSQTSAMWITSAFLALMSLTGLPMMPMLILSGITGGIAYSSKRKQKQQQTAAANQAAARQKQTSKDQPIEQVMTIDTLELEVGYMLVRLVDASQGGDLLDRITMIRRQLAAEMGLVMPPVRIRDNMQLQPHDYHIRIRGNTVSQGSAYPGQFLAMDSGLATTQLEGIKTREPAFGLEAVWIDAGQKSRAESLNYTVVDPASVLATHLTEVVKNHAYELLTREETSNLIVQLRKSAPRLADEVLGPENDKNHAGLIRPGELQKVLQNLLRERVPIRDMETIVETLGDWIGRTKDLDVLTEYVRNALRRTICNQFVQAPPADRGDSLTPTSAAPRLYCISLDPALEDQVVSFIDRTGEGTTLTMPPAVANRITTAMVKDLQRLLERGYPPVVLASPQVRASIRRLLEPHLPHVAVLGYNEVSKGVDVESLAIVQLDDQPAEASLQGAIR